MTHVRKVAVITGGGSGVGRHSAIALLDSGFSVVVAGRRPEALDETVEMAGDRADQVLAVPTDVRDPDAIRHLFERTTEAFGRLDVLFNNAGIGAPPVLLEDLSLEDWQAVVEVNLTGAFLCTQEAMRIMKSQEPMGGRIINNGSVSAQVPRPNSVAYTATKHAMTGLTKSTCLDGRKYNITCGQIDIGNAHTDMGGKAINGMMQPNGEVVPEPTIDVDIVANAVRYMADLPLDANVPFITVMATKMPLIGRG